MSLNSFEIKEQIRMKSIIKEDITYYLHKMIHLMRFTMSSIHLYNHQTKCFELKSKKIREINLSMYQALLVMLLET